MSQYPPLGGATRVDDNFLSLLIENWIIKPADATARVNSTLLADPDLTFPVVANAVYDVTFRFRWAGLLAAGLSTSWTVPAGTTGNRDCAGPGTTNAAVTDANATSMRWNVAAYGTAALYTNPRNSVSLSVFCEEKAIVSVGSTAGSITLNWAQWTTNATGSLLNAQSYARYRRIG